MKQGHEFGFADGTPSQWKTVVTSEEAHAGGAQDDLVPLVLCTGADHAQVVVHKGLWKLPRRACMRRAVWMSAHTLSYSIVTRPWQPPNISADSESQMLRYTQY